MKYLHNNWYNNYLIYDIYLFYKIGIYKTTINRI